MVKLRKRKLFLINGIILTLTSIFMRCVGLIFNIYISNKIGSEAVGIFTLVMSVYLFFVTVANSGLSVAVTYTLSEEFAIKQKKEAYKAIRTGIFFSLLLGIVAGGFIIFASPVLSHSFLQDKVSPVPFYFIAIGLPFIAMSSCMNGYFSSIRKSYKTAIAQVLELLVKIMMTIVFLSWSISKGVEAICISLILADVISEIVSFLYLFVLYQKDKKKNYSISLQTFGQKKKLIKIAFPVAITSYLRSGLSTLKQLLIPSQLEKSGLSASTALSNYGVINGMVLPVLLFPNVLLTSFSSLLIPEISTYLAQKNNKAIHFVCDKIFRITGVFSIGIASIFFVFSHEISLLIYQSIESASYFKLLAPLIFFIYFDNIIDGILKGMNKQFAVMCCNVLDLSLTVLLIYFLLPILGIYGYLVSIFVSEILNFTVSFLQLIRTLHFKINWMDWFLKPIFCAWISFLCLCLLPISFSSLGVNLVLSCVVFFILYLILCFFTKSIRKKDLFN